MEVENDDSSSNLIVLEELEVKDLYQINSLEFWEICEPISRARLTHCYGTSITRNSIQWGRNDG